MQRTEKERNCSKRGLGASAGDTQPYHGASTEKKEQETDIGQIWRHTGRTCMSGLCITETCISHVT